MTEQHGDDRYVIEWFDIPPWNAESIMRRRTADVRNRRDAAIRRLRESLTDQEIYAEFGLDLRKLEG